MFGIFTKYQRTKGIDLQTRMHSSRMCTARGSSRQLGFCLTACWDAQPPGCGPGDPPSCGPGYPPGCGPGDLPGCGPGDHPGVGLETPQSPLGVGLETPLARPLNLPPGCGPGDPLLTRPLNLPLGVGLENCKACWDTTPTPGDLQGMLRHHLAPVDRQTRKNITFANFICGR